jgi:hypothetical protein
LEFRAIPDLIGDSSSNNRELLLSRPFNLFNSFVCLEMQEKEKLIAMNIVNDFDDLLNEKDAVI